MAQPVTLVFRLLAVLLSFTSFFPTTIATMHRQFLAAYRVVFFGCLLLLLVLTSGCEGGGPGVPVQGRVTLDGEPLEEGKIVFQPLEGGPSAGGNIVQGDYSINANDGPTEGRYQVQILAYRGTGRIIEDPVDGDWEEMESAVPERYTADSELRAEVVRGEKNTFDFELESD